jgi:hypothetical protein
MKHLKKTHQNQIRIFIFCVSINIIISLLNAQNAPSDLKNYGKIFSLIFCILIIYSITPFILKIKKNLFEDSVQPKKFFSRRLLSSLSESASRKYIYHNETILQCLRPDIEQFPKGFINQKYRRHGAVIIHFLIAIYMFIALAIVCDEYFVPSLNIICKRFNLKEDVAGIIS